MPENDLSVEGNYVGFQVNKSELDNWGDPEPTTNPGIYPTDFTGDSISEPVETRVQCWAGEPSERPSEDNIINFIAEADAFGLTAAFGAPPRTNFPDKGTDEFNAQTFHCIWGFSQNITEYNEKIEAVPLYTPDGNPINDKETYFEDHSTAYIIEGINNFGRIKSFQGSLMLPGGHTDGTEQEDHLRTHIGDLYKADTADNYKPFNIYPEGGETARGGSGNPNRNPVSRFIDSHS